MGTRKVYSPVVQGQTWTPCTVTIFYDNGAYHAIDWGGGVEVPGSPNADFATTTNAAIVYVQGLGGGIIYVVEGPHTVTIQIILVSGVALVGSGYGTLLDNTNTGVASNAIICLGTAGSHETGIMVANLRIRGRNGGENAIAFTYVDDCIIENLWIEETGEEGIHCDNCLRAIIRSNHINTTYDPASSCLEISNCFDSVVLSNTVRNSAYVGILARDSQEGLIASNTVLNSANYSIQVYETGAPTNNCLWNIVIGNTVRDGTIEGIRIEKDEHIILGNVVENCRRAIDLSGASRCTVCNNVARGSTNENIRLISASHENVISANIVRAAAGAAGTGINIVSSDLNTITANTITLNGAFGINLDDADLNTISSNIIKENSQEAVGVRHGIRIVGTSASNNIVANVITDDTRDGIFMEDTVDNTFIEGNTITANTNYGINISVATVTNTLVGRNRLTGNPAGCINEAGTGTKLPTIPLYCVSYNTNTTHEDGIEIDEAGEWASFVGQLPLEVQQVVRFEIWAVGLAAPGAGNQMCLEIEIEGGAEDEALNTHDTGALAAQLSDTINFAINDIIKWTTIHANALALLGGDSVKCVVRHNVAVNTDIATDASFRRVLLHVV